MNMKIYLWEVVGGFSNIVLWDGENTYWTDEMRPSYGYFEMRTGICKLTDSRFTYVGEL